jgi:hypothetical protein
MRYRKLDASGDYTVGGSAVFLVNSPDAVAQAIKTRLGLWQGEWFVDTTDGTPWLPDVLGKRHQGKNPDAVIKQRILGTQGVTEITDYTSTFDGETRKLSVTAVVNTIYGTVTITETL